MKKEQRSKYTALNKVVILAAVVVLSFAAWSLIRDQQRSSEENYFSELATTTLNYYSQHAPALGLQPSDSDLERLCYQTGQGPFDNGHLTCETRVQKKIQIEAGDKPASDIFSELADVLNENEFIIVGGSTEVARSGSFSAGIYNNPDAPCRSHLAYISSDASRDESVGALEYSLNCSKRASHIPPGFSYTPLLR